MTYEIDNNNFATTTGADEVIDMGKFNVPAKISSVTTVTDKAVAKAAKQAEKDSKAQALAQAKAAKEAEQAATKAAKAADRAQAKAEKEAAKVAAEAKEIAIALAVKDALIKGAVIAQKYESAETGKVAFKNSSREATYDLLVEVMSYVEELYQRNDLTEVLSVMRTQLWKNWKLKTQENTSDLGVIVKYITRTKRKNAHMYTRVLDEAFKHKATSATLLQYINLRGGINKIVAGNKAKNISNKKRMHNAYKRYAHAVLAHEQHNGGMGKIPLTPKQVNHHCDTRDNAHFVYTFCKIERDELVVIDFVPWVNNMQEEEFLLYHTLSTIKVPGNSTHLDEAMSNILHKKMAVMFDKYNAIRLKNNLSPINQLGEVSSGPQPDDFSVFDWAQFDADYAEYLAAKAQQTK